ncbi:MAG TPA: DUF3344 domain-containing protein [Methanolinea sp.]|nr:DUF3344 domain-containing protein [Methanolinea sp.]HQK56420.1 DUF3344 domain-containing protein [Methanolinea sp.]
MQQSRQAFIACILLSLFFITIPTTALYDFEGLAFRSAAQGEVIGELVTAGTFGLTNPPVECTLTLERAPKWARIYTGVWGGTEKYSGWAQFTVNGKQTDRITLYGQDDRTEGVYCSGHGVYWIAQDATALLGPGENTISASTSKGEAGSKIDGRVYAVMVVAAVEKDGGEVVRYIVMEGNENLHGEGWAGTNPTWRDRVEVPIGGMPTDGVKKAELSVLLVATNRGQPDYVLFNGADLGVAPTRGTYLPGAKDIGNEQSCDAAGGAGFESRYVDMESFDVTGVLHRDNVLVFERGRDLDGDGNISTTGATPEGEDYIHPCLAILAVTRAGPATSVSLAVDSLDVRNAYAGEPAVITAVVRSTGAAPAGPVSVTLTVDGISAGSREVTLPASGWAEVTLPWTAVGGTHAIAVEAAVVGASPGRAERTVKVGTPADLAVSVGHPARQDSPLSPQATTPFPLGALAGAPVLGWWLYTGKSRNFAFLIAVGMVLAVFAVPVVQAAGSTQVIAYTLPIEIKNLGGSDTPAFEVTVLLDGEQVTRISVPGIPAGGVLREQVTLHTIPGPHTVSVIADEKGTIPERERGNNRADARYDFP